MTESITIFSDKLSDIEFARENCKKIVRFASNLVILKKTIAKYGPRNIFVLESCIDSNFLAFTDQYSIPYFKYADISELDILLSKEIPPEIYEIEPKKEKKPKPEPEKYVDTKDYQKYCEISPAFACLTGSSAAISKLRRDIIRVAVFDVPVLLLGETGTGKTTVARAIHELSPRRKKIFKGEVISNMNETLVESKLFGVTEGAFTGAVSSKGLFEEADGGTLFLDEIGEISPSVQVKLLKVLSESVISRIGSNKEIHVDNRMIFATNANLERKILEKTFRDDLFYRINDVTLKIPPLRERLEDIPDLCRMILKREKIQKEISDSAISLLQTFTWKGNIRQLEKCLKNAARLYCDGDIIEPRHIKV